VAKKKLTVDLSQDCLFPLGWGLVFRAVCAPKSWSPERISREATRNDPPGTSENRWVISKPERRDDVFNGTNCVPCPDSKDRQHWLLNC